MSDDEHETTAAGSPVNEGDGDTVKTEGAVRAVPTEVKKKKKKTTKRKEGQDAFPPSGFAERDSGPSELTDEVADEFAQARDLEQGPPAGGTASKVQNVVTYIADTVAETVATVASVIPIAQVDESEDVPEKMMSSKSGKVGSRENSSRHPTPWRGIRVWDNGCTRRLVLAMRNLSRS